MKALQNVAAVVVTPPAKWLMQQMADRKKMITFLLCYINGKMQQNITDHDTKRNALSEIYPKFRLQ